MTATHVSMNIDEFRNIAILWHNLAEMRKHLFGLTKSIFIISLYAVQSCRNQLAMKKPTVEHTLITIIKH